MVDEAFLDVMSKFNEKFGRICIWGHGTGFFYIKKTPPFGDFDVDFLNDDEILELMKKSIQDNFNYLYEKVKNHPAKPLKPDCLY